MRSGGASVRLRARLVKRPVTRTGRVVLLLFLGMTLAGCGGGGGATQDVARTEPGKEAVAPTPGGMFSGPVEVTGAASSATISLVVSADGASITSVGVSLKDLKTETFSAGSMEKQVSGSIPIKDGSFSGSLSGLGEIEGRFTSPSEGSGTVKLNLEIPFSAPADLGEFGWTASLQ